MMRNFHSMILILLQHYFTYFLFLYCCVDADEYIWLLEYIVTDKT